MSITRRDFVNGVAITIAAGLSPLELAQANPQLADKTLYYPPALTGLRGSHQGSFENAHQLARRGKQFYYQSLPVEEEYDLIVVGAGISGLASAWFYRKQYGADKKILLLDNHADFGGHAARNEFTTPARPIIGYGGSESFQSPHFLFSDVVNTLMDDLGVDVDALASHFSPTFYPDLGLAKGVYFDKKNFGVDKVVVGDPGREVADDIPFGRENGRTYRNYISDFPMPKTDQEALITLHEETVDYLAGMSMPQKLNYMASTSYANFLKDKVKLSPLAIKYFQQQTNDFQAIGIDSTSCDDARLCALPGFGGANLPPLGAEETAELNDPYIYHFPDGNASVARLLVKKLIPAVTQSSGMVDLLQSTFDYAQLDVKDAPTRLRLNSTCIHAQNTDDNRVEVAYVTAEGSVKKIKGAHAIMAGYNMMIPHMVPTLPERQKTALSQNVKAPLVYTKVVISNWQSFIKLGAHKIYSPAAPYSVVKLDYPVSMGGYDHPKKPDEPICLHMIYVPAIAGSGLPAREQFKMGRAQLMSMPFETYEAQLREQLQGMLGGAGFNHETDILGITVNRWSHGYSYFTNTLWDDEDADEKTILAARKPFHNIHIANSDSDWNPYAHAAIDQAWRAVQEIFVQAKT